MGEYVLRRFLQMLLVIGLMSLIVFTIIRLIPGDPAAVNLLKACA